MSGKGRGGGGGGGGGGGARENKIEKYYSRSHFKGNFDEAPYCFRPDLKEYTCISDCICQSELYYYKLHLTHLNYLK
jgi:hypothetical protein